MNVPLTPDTMADDALSRLLRFIENAKTETERLARQANRLAEGLEDLAYLLGEWQRNPQTLIQLAKTDARDLVAGLQARLRAQERLAVQAESGVGRVDILWRPDGTALARVDEHPPLGLSPNLGLLLEILTADDGLSADPFVSWKTRDRVRKAILQRTGTVISAGNLNTLVWRLGVRLQKAGLPRQWIQRHARRGLRFALRRKHAPLAPANPLSPPPAPAGPTDETSAPQSGSV